MVSATVLVIQIEIVLTRSNIFKYVLYAFSVIVDLYKARVAPLYTQSFGLTGGVFVNSNTLPRSIKDV